MNGRGGGANSGEDGEGGNEEGGGGGEGRKAGSKRAEVEKSVLIYFSSHTAMPHAELILTWR